MDSTLLARFQAVAEPTRFRIVRILADGERCVCELQDELGATQSRLSFHLKKLKEAGVVADRPCGRWVYYSLVPEALEGMRRFLGEVRPEPWREAGPATPAARAARTDSDPGGCGDDCSCGACC